MTDSGGFPYNGDMECITRDKTTHSINQQQTAGPRALLLMFMMLLLLGLTALYMVDLQLADQPLHKLHAIDEVYAADQKMAEKTGAANQVNTGAATADEAAQLTFSADNYRPQTIAFPFLDTATVAYEWSFPYSDEFFRQPSEEFSRTMAQGSLGLAASAFRSDKYSTAPLQYETYLAKAGFTELKSFGYDQPTTGDSLSGVIGHKEIDGFTVIAATTCGQGYGGEWAGNLKVGDGEIHQGFQEASAILTEHLDDYIREHDIDPGQTKLWLTGISRAAAVANLTAAQAIRSGDWADVYAYLFGVPRTTKVPEKYPGIYNICGQYDPVAQAPLQSWGYERYGTDLFTPAQETDSDYPRLARAASKVSRELSGEPFRNNPEMNHQIHLVLEFMGEFFPESGDYADRLQDILMKTWKDPTQDNIAEVAVSAVGQMKDLNHREEHATDALLNYVSMVAAQHTRANQPQVLDGSWDPNAPLAANMVLEHRPSTYVKWLFSETSNEELFTFADATRRISISDTVDVDVYQGGELLGSIASNGTVTYPDTEDTENAKSGQARSEPFLMNNGSESVINLPEDAPCRIVLTARGSDTVPVSYHDITFSTEQMEGRGGYLSLVRLDPGTYEIRSNPGEELAPLRTITGDADIVPALPYEYTAVQQMTREARAGNGTYLSMEMAVLILLGTFAILSLLFLIHLILFAVYLRRRRHGRREHSPWVSIVPHLFYVLVFMALTLLMTYYMFTIGQTRAVCAALAVGFTAVLALRGSLYRRELRNVLVTAALFALSFFTWLFYANIPQGAIFGPENVVLYCAAMAILCLAAIGTFYGFRRPGSGSRVHRTSS